MQIPTAGILGAFVLYWLINNVNLLSLLSGIFFAAIALYFIASFVLLIVGAFVEADRKKKEAENGEYY